MKAKKIIVKVLMKDLEGQVVTKKSLDDYIRTLADEDAGFESKVFDIGVKALVKEYEKSCKGKRVGEIESEELHGVNKLIRLVVSVMRAQGSDERDIKKCVISLYDQAGIPEEEREIRHTGVVRWQEQSRERGFIKDDNGNIVRFYKNDIAGDNDALLKKGEIVSFITDGKIAWNIENYLHYVPDGTEQEDDNDFCTSEEREESDFPLRYHEVEENEELEVLKDLSLVSRMRDKFGDDGDGTDFTFRETDGVRMINLFVMDNGGMYLSDWY